METRVATCSCPGIYQNNTRKRAMLLLNIGISALTVALTVGEDEWLMEEVI